MIAYDSRGVPEDARELSAATRDHLRLAIDERWRAEPGRETEQAAETLAAALAAAASEARQRALHAETLVVAIKAIEADVAAERGRLGHADRRALRAWLVTACIRAYFSQP
jgi:hypothetical protein